MPSSHWLQINEILSVIRAVDPKYLLDVGVGFGKFGVLAREYLEFWDGRNNYYDWKRRIDGIEAFKDYENPIHHFIYDKIYYGDAKYILPGMEQTYDLIIMIDVLEHFTKEGGDEIIKLGLKAAKKLLIVTPHNPSDQGAVFHNEYEEHKSAWCYDEIASYTKEIVAIKNRFSLITLSGVNLEPIYLKIRDWLKLACSTTGVVYGNKN